MALTRTAAVRLSDPSGTAEARRTAAALAHEAGFDDQDVGRIALVVTELCSNVVKHAGSGVAALSACTWGGGRILQVVTVDGGRGFDVEQGLRDGHSTAGTPGGGLGAARRLSDAFDAYSVAGQGSVLVAEFHDRRQQADGGPRLRLGAVCVAKDGEHDCGDAWAASWAESGARVFVADGIGHGTDAASAAQAAIHAFEASGERRPAEVMERVHAALRPTRGATVALTSIEIALGVVRFAGIGNISASIVGAGPARHLVSFNGTAGHEVRKLQEFKYDWPEGGLLIMASDGLGTRWDLERYPGVRSRHPAIVAGVLYRDFGRPHDDVTVVAARLDRPHAAGGRA